MAGKKRNQVSDVPMSKTARASASKGKKKDEGFQASGDMDRIIPLCGGEWAYVLDPRDGRTHHLKVGSDKWTLIMSELLTDPKHNSRVQSQLTRLGWNGR